MQQGDFFEFKQNQVAAEARMLIRTEAGLLDQFLSALPVLDRGDGEEVVLQCLSVGRDA